MNKDLINQAKAKLRDKYRSERVDRFINDSWLHLLSASEFAGKQSIASYISYEVEPNTEDLNQELIKNGATLYLPRMLTDGDLEWVLWNGDLSNLKKVGKIFEPIGEPSDPKLDVVIVPALHIDQRGNRLGQGGGSYDRALAKTSAWKVALVHPGEISNEPLPTNEFDQPVNAAATPSMLVRF
jgi:5-formyltetrahydrofolate cyclo-ligase